MRPRSLLVVLIAALAPLAACSDDDTGAEDGVTVPTGTDEQRFPDVVDVDVDRSADGTARFDVTVSSPYDTPERYADAWRIVGPDGVELGVRELAHDHANEQPFTRSLDGVAIPADVARVTVEARDSTHGWGGATVDVDL